jgi:hypothetical protein
MRIPLSLAASFFLSCAARTSTEPTPSSAAVGAANASDGPIVVQEGDCTITVGRILTFDVHRGGYRPEETTTQLPQGPRAQAEGEDLFEAHGRCVLDVHVGNHQRSYLHVVQGFIMQGPAPSREQCLAARTDVARHLMTMTEHCADPDGRGDLARTLP